MAVKRGILSCGAWLLVRDRKEKEGAKKKPLCITWHVFSANIYMDKFVCEICRFCQNFIKRTYFSALWPLAKTNTMANDI